MRKIRKLMVAVTRGNTMPGRAQGAMETHRNDTQQTREGVGGRLWEAPHPFLADKCNEAEPLWEQELDV